MTGDGEISRNMAPWANKLDPPMAASRRSRRVNHNRGLISNGCLPGGAVALQARQTPTHGQQKGGQNNFQRRTGEERHEPQGE